MKDIQIPNRYFYRQRHETYHPVVAYLTDTGYEVLAWSDNRITLRGHDGHPVTYQWNKELTQAIQQLRKGRNMVGDVHGRLKVIP